MPQRSRARSNSVSAPGSEVGPDQNGSCAAGAALPAINQLAPIGLMTTFARPEIVKEILADDDEPGEDSVVYARDDMCRQM